MNNTDKTDEKSNFSEPAKVIVEFDSIIEAASCLEVIGFLITLCDEGVFKATDIFHIGNLVSQTAIGIQKAAHEIGEGFNSLTGNNRVIANLPFTINERTFQTILSLLNFNAQLPPLEEIDQINLQITIDNGGETNV